MRIFTIKKHFFSIIILFAFLIGSSTHVVAQCPTIINTNQSFCDVQSPTVASLQATDNGGGIRWYATANSTTALSNATILANGEDYFADDATGTCGVRQSVTVTIYSAPTGANFQGVCVTSLTQATILNPQFSITGVGLKWYTVPFGGIAISNSTILNDNTIYYISQTNPDTGCETSRLSVFVNVGLVPVPTGDAVQEFCNDSGNPPTIADLVASGNNNWYLTSDFGIPLDPSTPLVNGQFYYATTVDPPCESDDRLEVLVNIYEPNDAGNDGSRSICSNQVTTTPLFNLYDLLGGTPDNTGVWSGPIVTTNGFQGTLDVSSMTEVGSPYIFTYTVSSALCVTDTSTVTITILPLPTASVTANPSTICENGTTTLTFTGTPNATVTYNINGEANQTITLNAAGTATIVVSPTATGTISIVSVASSGTPSCINPQTSSIPITVLPLPTASVTANPTTICQNGTTTLTFTGTPNATVTYNINGGANQTITLNAAGTATIVVSPTATGTINIVSVASSGTPSCINPQTSSIPITVLPLPTASVTANPTTICQNGTTTLTFTGTPNATVTYNINGGTNQTITLNAAGTATISVSPTATGTINIVSVASSGTPSCINPQTSSIPITVLPLPTASVTANPTTICQNGTTTLTFTGTPNATVTYNINGGTNQTITLNAAGTATISVSPTTTGTINIVSVASSGTPSCINPQTSSIPITVLPLPTASVTANPTTICQNGTTTLTFTGTPNATVTYNINGGTNQTITLNASGTATILVSPTTTGTINIVSVASSGTPSCINPQTSSIPITVLPLPTASVTANPSTICENGTTTLTFTGTPNSTVTYNINGGTNQTITLNAAGTATISVSPTATGTINIVSVASSGTPSCINPQTSSIPITVLPLPTASVTANPTTICQNGTTTLTFTGTPNATVTYNINGGTNQTITLNAAGTATIVVSPTATGTINIVSVASSGNPSCINPQTSSIPITVLPLPTASVTANPTTICQNGTTTLTFTGTPNATVTYNINGGTNQTITLNAAGTATISVSPTTTGTINIVSVASSGTPSCINPQTSSIPITVLPLPTASVTANPSTICENGTTTLTFTGTPNATVTYNINGGTNQTITLNAAGTATIVVSPTATGTINIVSVASSGNPSCINPQTSSIPITVLPLPTASVTANPSTICENGTTTLTFTGTPNATVTYNINGGTNQTITLNAAGTATIVVSPTATGTINIVSVASSGNPSCTNPQTSIIPITVLPLPTASVTANPSTICENGTTTLTFTGTPNATVTYNINGGTNQTITLNAAGTATIVVSPTTTGTINIVSVASSGTPSCTNPQTSSIPITVLPLPTASVTANTSTICENGTTTLTFTGTPNATVTYNINGGTNQTITLNAAGTATIVVSPTATGTINIVSVASLGTPSCINPQTSSIPITVLPLPTASVTANPSTICENGTTTLTFTGTPNATVTYNINGGANQTITLNAAGTATIAVSPTTTGTINIVSVASLGTPSCNNPQPSSIPITIVEAPVAGVAPQPQVFCVTSPSIDLFLLLGNTAQTGGTWSSALASGTGVFNPAVDLSGSYTYTVTGNPLCPPAQVTVQVTVNPIPNAGSDVVNYNICSNQNPVDLFTLLGSNAQTGGTWSPTLVSGTGVLNPSVDASTTYTYTVVGIAPCVDDFATIEVIITQGPEAGNSNSITVCENSNPQDLFLALGPNAQTGGTWSPALTSGTGVFDPALDLAGDYTYSLSGNDPCDNDEATITVIVNPVPDAGEDGTHIFCTNDAPQDLFDFLNGNPQTGGTWSPALASGTGVFNPLVDVATTYTYTVGGNLCDTDTANVVITVVQSPIAGADGQLTTCADVINLDLTTGLDGTQGVGTWTDDDNTSALTGNVFNPSLVGVGTYTFTYTVTGGTSPCTTDTSVVTVTVNPLPNAGDFVATSPICTSVGTFDLDTLLTGQDLGGNWLDSTNTIIVNPINVSALTSGVYNYTYEVTNSCGDDEQLVQLEILPTPVVLTSNVTITPICIGGNATVQFSGMQDGNYTINYSVSGVNNITTQSETITITGGLGSFSIPSTSLSNIGTSTITFENITNTVTNCTATLTNSSAIIEVKPLLDIFPNVITVANVCLGTDVTVVYTNATNFPDGTYQFNYTIPTGNPTTGNSGDVLITAGNGQFTIPASVFATVGSYALTLTGITSTTECSNPTVSSSVTFDVQATPNSGTFTGLISICPSTGVLDLNSLLENEDTGGEWKDSTGQVVNSPLTIINFSPATYSYTYTVTNSCASVSTTVQFTILPNPQIASFNISINPNCLGIDTIVTLNGMVDGIYAISYDLSGSNTLAGQTATVTIAAGTGTFTIPSSNLTNIGTTVITITAILNTVSTCSNNVVNVSAQIQITPLSSIDSSNISISNVCIGDDLTVQITNATNLVDGVYQFSYSIPNANPTTGNSGDVTITSGNGQFTIPAASFSTAGNYILTIVGITTNSGCSNTTVTATTNFTIQPSLDITGATVSAQDTCVNFQSLVTISNANNLPDDSYTITYTLSGANAFTETITIPFVSGSAIFPLAQTNLTNAGSTTITITDIISTTVICGLNGITFPPYSFEVEQLGTPTLIQEGNLFCEDENPTIANLSANILNGQTVIWYTSETGGTAYAETDLLVHNTTYYAALISQSGCEGPTRLEVTVDLTICDDILIPDGFSPNDDTINDTFEIKNLPIVYPNFKLEIYNRYGNILYNGNKNTPLWDGTTTEKGLNVGGNVLPTGVYFYILYFNDGVKKPVQGRLYLSR